MESSNNNLHQWFKKNARIFHPVVSFDPSKEKLIPLDFTESNEELQKINFENTEEFTQYISDKLTKEKSKYGIGGYDELRTVYSMSNLFNNDLQNVKQVEKEEPRRLHLGVDIWGKEGTEIFAPLDGTIHSFAFNDHFGDYGATIILEHRFNNHLFYTLYGHLSLTDIQNIKPGDFIKKGNVIAHFGNPLENGHWPPHLHFQLIKDMGDFTGDYPGVCKFSEREKYLSNCPNPDFILQLNKWI